MRGGGAALALTVALIASPAIAEAETVALYDRLWPRVPEHRQLKLSQQITDQLTELGNTLGHHVDALSSEMLQLRFDGRRRKAFVRIGGGDTQYLTFRLSSDVQFVDGMAKVSSHVDLAIAGRALRLELPDFEMVPASYRGDRGVEVRLPLFRRSF